MPNSKKSSNLFPILFGALAGAGSAFITSRYRRWYDAISQDLIQGSSIAPTRVGPIEYGIIGQGPVILVFHGAPGGYDQALLYQDLVDAGYSVLGFSRPGYLQTSIRVGHTIKKQADAAAALLDALEIEDVVALGVSAGGPMAIQFALRHPEKTKALVLQAAVSHAYIPSDDATNSLLGKIFLSESVQDFMMYAMNWFSRQFPELALKEMLRVETTYQDYEIDDLVLEILQRPKDIEFFQQLLSTTAPMRPRKRGLDNDLEQLARIPRYPLEKIDVPSLIIHSRYDGDVPFTHAEYAASNIPNAQFVPIDGAGHFIWLGKAGDIVLEAMTQFLHEVHSQ